MGLRASRAEPELAGEEPCRVTGRRGRRLPSIGKHEPPFGPMAPVTSLQTDLAALCLLQPFFRKILLVPLEGEFLVVGLQHQEARTLGGCAGLFSVGLVGDLIDVARQEARTIVIIDQPNGMVLLTASPAEV